VIESAGAKSKRRSRSRATTTSAKWVIQLRSAGQKGIDTLVADWHAFDIDAAGFRRAFDLVYAQMVPSFRDVADFARFETCRRSWRVFIGWARDRHDPWLEAAFAAKLASTADCRAWLTGSGPPPWSHRGAVAQGDDRRSA